MIIDGIHYKTCISCRKQLPRGCFSKNEGYVDGWSHKCKPCLRVKRNKSRGAGAYKDNIFAKAQVMRFGHAKI